jgi:hypothetical protein
MLKRYEGRAAENFRHFLPVWPRTDFKVLPTAHQKDKKALKSQGAMCMKKAF